MIAQLLSILSLAVWLYTLIIFAWVILSWFRQGSRTVRNIYKVLDPICAPYVNLFRKIIPPMGGLDFTPFVAIIVLQLALQLLRLLFGLLL